MTGAALAAGDADALARLVAALAETWNRMDGDAFADLFAEDAVFVDIKANRDNGRDAIAERHRWLFEGVFRGTSIGYDLIDARMIGSGLALGHIRAHVDTGGGTLETLATCVFREAGGAWLLLAFHNTEISHFGA